MNDSANLSDIGRFDPHSAETSWTLPSSWYHRPQIYQLDRQRIFARTWCYQCHRSELDEPGDAYQGNVEYQPVTIKRLPTRDLRVVHSLPAAAATVALSQRREYANHAPGLTQ